MSFANSSVWSRLGLVIAGGLLGLIGLPSLFQSLRLPGLSLVWLALAMADALLLLWTTPLLFRAFAEYLGRLTARLVDRHVWSDRATGDLARLLVAAAYVVLVQALVRRPLVAVFGVDIEPFIVEAVWGAAAFVVLLSLLAGAYAVARPLVEGIAWNALDAAFVTAPTTVAADDHVLSRSAADSDATVGATPAATQVAPVVTEVRTRPSSPAAATDMPTVVGSQRFDPNAPTISSSQRSDDCAPTVLSSQPANDDTPTVLSGQPANDDAPTVLSGQRPDDNAPTVLSSRPDESGPSDHRVDERGH